MKTILVIEDEQAIRESLCDLLEVEGFSVLDAELGKEGVQLAEARLPDLILCDVHMPDMDGYHVLSHLRQNPHARTIPFIFLTAKGARADQRYGMNLGADDYLVKPCTSEEILAAITSRINRQDTLLSQSQHQLNTLRNNIALSLPHELHTPLNSILLFAEILMSEYDSIDRQEILQISEGIHTSANRLHRLIQNFLLYAQLEIATNDPVKRESLCSGQTALPHLVITEVATRLARQAGREADLVLQLKDATIRMSDLRLQKVVEELIGNAFKFSNAGHQVYVSSTVGLGGFVLRIVDQGRGMLPEQIASLGAYMQFDRHFYEQQGTGLGLIIAKRIVELHGGSLTIESVLGKQTCIRVIVPLQPLPHPNS
ncbi:response regulator [Phormidium tenue FACHB-886]|nr:response regulator [Phormidium tenue FACHB-886]